MEVFAFWGVLFTGLFFCNWDISRGILWSSIWCWPTSSQGAWDRNVQWVCCHRCSDYQLYEILREHERVPRLWHALSTMHILMKIVLWQRKHCKMMVEDVLEQFFGVSSTRQSRAKTIFDHRVWYPIVVWKGKGLLREALIDICNCHGVMCWKLHNAVKFSMLRRVI